MGAASDAANSQNFDLPPRRETFLARYSRQSKLAIIGLALVSLIALSYIAVRGFSSGNAARAAGHHAPTVHGADAEHEQDGEQAATGGKGGAPRGSGVETINAQDDRSIELAMAPDPDVTETSGQGDLPKIAEDGRQPWQVYSRPFNTADKRPRVAILVMGLGLSRTTTAAAVNRLPAAVTLAFDAQSPVVSSWCGAARREGHEVLLSVPTEPFDYPRSDPGPHTLLTSASNSANQEKFIWALRQASGYVGIVSASGSLFTTDPDKVRPILETLHQRGLMVVDARDAPHSVVTDVAHDLHVPVAVQSDRIDDNLSPAAIDAALQELVQEARLNGHALGIVQPLPIVIDHLQTWLKTLPQQGIALAPVSAVVQ